jgi:hypothetical protein
VVKVDPIDPPFPTIPHMNGNYHDYAMQTRTESTGERIIASGEVAFGLEPALVEYYRVYLANQ